MFWVVWLIVGSVWTYGGINRGDHNCPSEIYDASFWLNIVMWIIWLPMLFLIFIIGYGMGMNDD